MPLIISIVCCRVNWGPLNEMDISRICGVAMRLPHTSVSEQRSVRTTRHASSASQETDRNENSSHKIQWAGSDTVAWELWRGLQWFERRGLHSELGLLIETLQANSTTILVYYTVVYNAHSFVHLSVHVSVLPSSFALIRVSAKTLLIVLVLVP